MRKLSNSMGAFSRYRACLVGAVYLVGALAGSVSAQPEKPTQTPSEIERQILKSSGDWFNALMVGDVKALDSLQTDDFLTVQQGPGGVAVVGKARQMENIRKAGDSRPKFERQLSAVRVREYGTVAVLTALATFRPPGTKSGNVVSQAVITEIWVNDKGRWRLSHFQPTDVPRPGAK